MFKKRKSRKWTWLSPDRNIKNEIYFITTNKPFTNLEVVIKLNFNSNHGMVRAELIIKGEKKSRKHIEKRCKRYNANEDQLEVVLKKGLENYLQETKSLNLQQKYNTIESLITNRHHKHKFQVDMNETNIL